MHRPFVPTPDWLESNKEVMCPLVDNRSEIELILCCFRALYESFQDLTERQVTELTALILVLGVDNLTRELVSETDLEPGMFWYQRHLRFYGVYPTIEGRVVGWVRKNLPKNAPFWSKSEDWWKLFVTDSVRYQEVLKRVRYSFAQHLFKIPVTGQWGEYSRTVCKLFQTKGPQTLLLPWKTGELDGFTYKLLVKIWKRRERR